MVSVTYVLELWALSCYFIMMVIRREAGATFTWDLRELWMTVLFVLSRCKDFRKLFWEKSEEKLSFDLWFFFCFVLFRDIRQQDQSFAKKSCLSTGPKQQTNQTAWNFRKDLNNNRSLWFRMNLPKWKMIPQACVCDHTLYNASSLFLRAVLHTNWLLILRRFKQVWG